MYIHIFIIYIWYCCSLLESCLTLYDPMDCSLPSFPVHHYLLGFPCGSAGKESTCNVGDLGSVPGLWRSPKEGKGNLLQCSGLEKSIEDIVQGAAKSWTWLSNSHCPCIREFAQIHVHWVYDDLQSSHPLLPLVLLPPVFSSIRIFSRESTHYINWPEYWSFSFSFSIWPSSEYSGLIPFRIDWFEILIAQGTLKSLLQHSLLKASFLRHSAIFMVQLSHPHMTVGKTTVLFIQTFVSKVMSLHFNT